MVVVANRMSSTTTTFPPTRTVSSSSFFVRTWILWLRSICAGMSRRSGRRLAAEHSPAFHAEHDLALLVERFPAVPDQPDARSARRGARLEHGAPVGEGIARANRLQPADVVDPRGAEARGAPDVALDHQTHADRAGVPAARDEATEGAARRRLGVGMERLRVELARESDDLRLREAVAPHVGDVADLEVFPPHHGF